MYSVAIAVQLASMYSVSIAVQLASMYSVAIGIQLASMYFEAITVQLAAYGHSVSRGHRRKAGCSWSVCTRGYRRPAHHLPPPLITITTANILAQVHQSDVFPGNNPNGPLVSPTTLHLITYDVTSCSFALRGCFAKGCDVKLAQGCFVNAWITILNAWDAT